MLKVESLIHWRTIPVYVAAAFLVVIVKHAVGVIYNLYFHPLSKYPGPRSWAASRLPRIVQRTRGIEMWVRLEAHKQYGPVIRITPNELSWIEPGVWKDVWAHRQGQEEFMKHDMDRFRHPNGHYGILSAERADHSRYRRLLSHAFSEKAMREQQPRIVGYVDLLIRDLKEVAEQGPQDMVKWFNFTTFDVIGKLAFGEDFSCLSEKKIHPWIAMVFGNVKSIVMLGSIRRLGLEWLLPYVASSDQLAARVYNHNFTSEMMTNRVARGTNQHDFWDNVLAHQDKSTGMTHEEMVSNAANLVLAGSETTATLLSGCLYQLMANPTTLAKAIEEIRGAFTSDDQIDLFSTTQLPYTLAVLEETMRIYPPVPTQTNRTVPTGGATVLSQFIPAGTTISLSQYIANHYPDYWTRPESFLPERFLGGEEFANDCFDVMQPFSVGPRNCIGRNLAYAEMRLILCRFLWNFDVERVVREGEGEWMDQKTFILWEKHPLWVKLKPVVR